MGARHSFGRIRLAALAAAASVAFLPLTSAAGAASPARWSTPTELHGASSVGLGSVTSSNAFVSCSATGDCSGVGTYFDHDGNVRTYLDTEVAGSWGHARDVLGVAAGALSVQVTALSCGGAGDCVVIGSYASSEDTSFFGGGTPFLDEEVGGTWQPAIAVPGLAALTGGYISALTEVSCASDGNCAVTGSYYAKGTYPSFVADEHAGVWSRARAVPGLAAVGLSSGGLVEAPVDTLTCVTAGNCVLGGFLSNGNTTSDAYLAAEVNGTWGHATLVPGLATLNEGEDSLVGTISCSSPGNCAAGGTYSDADAAPQAFVVEESGGAWAHAEELPGTGALNTGGGEVNANEQTVGAQVQAIDCPTDGSCTAVGWYQTLAGASDLFVDSASSGVWGTAVAMPGLAALNDGATLQNDGAAAAGLACTGVGDCVIAGNYDDTTSNAQLFTEVESQGTFGPATELPGSGVLAARFQDPFGDTVNSLSCWAADDCALAASVPPGGAIDTETGGSWATAGTFVTSPTLYVGTNAGVQQLSCPLAGSCAAIGSYETAAGAEGTFFAQQTQGTWGADVDLSALDALSTGGLQFASFECASVGNCTLLATYVGTDDVTHLFSDAERSGTWQAPRAVAGLPAVTKGTLSFLFNGPRMDAVSCPSATRCVGVGVVVTSQTAEVPFVLTEASGTWKVDLDEPGSNLAGTHLLTDISCPTPGNCVATGSDLLSSGAREVLTAAESSGTWGTARVLTSPSRLSRLKGRASEADVYELTCTAVRTCEAAGSTAIPSENSEPFVMSEIGGTWHAATFLPGFALLAKVVPRSGFFYISPSALTCPNATTCTLVGDYPVDYENDFGDLEASFVLSSFDGHWSDLDLLANPRSTRTARSSTTSDFAVSGLACPTSDRCLTIGITTKTTETEVSSDESTFTYSYSLAGGAGFGSSFAAPVNVSAPFATFGAPPYIIDDVSCGTNDRVGPCAVGGSFDNGRSSLPFAITAP